MILRAIALVLSITLFMQVLTPQARAQNPASSTESPDGNLTGTRKQIATIVFAGLAGAVLGLSTLSFYGRPQDRLSNIAVGFAVGVIIGTGYTTFQAATKPREMYQESRFDVSPLGRVAQVNWSWDF